MINQAYDIVDRALNSAGLVVRAAGPHAVMRDVAPQGRNQGRTLRGLVERPGLARAEDFTELTFEGEAVAGQCWRTMTAGC